MGPAKVIHAYEVAQGNLISAIRGRLRRRLYEVAHRHGVSDETVLHAFNPPIRDDDLDGDMTMPRPNHRVGPVLAPSSLEFWQARTDGLHDRLLYHRENLGGGRASGFTPELEPSEGHPSW